jgi:hypothetical protein
MKKEVTRENDVNMSKKIRALYKIHYDAEIKARLAWYVARMGRIRNGHKTVVGNHEGMRQIGRPGHR